MTLNPWEIAIINGQISAYLHGTLEVDGLLSVGSGLKIPAGQTYAVGATDRAFLNTEAVTHAALDTGIHGAGVSTLATVENITTHTALDTGVHGAGGDVLATDADITTHNSDTTSVHGITDTSKLTVIASGNYTGDDSVNRAIAHGLGIKPKIVIINNVDSSTGQIVGFIIKDDHVSSVSYSGHAVTAKNSTNFYVGNATNYTYSMNSDGNEHYWVAYG